MSHAMPRFLVALAAVCATVFGAAVWGTTAANAVDVGPTAHSVISWDPGDETNIGGEAIGPTGTIWVTQYNDGGTAGSILGFAPGTTSPEFDITGNDTGLLEPAGIAIDSSGNVWVSDYQADAVFEYKQGATGDAEPIDTIDTSGQPSGVAIGPDQSIYVALDVEVDVYAPGPGNTVTFSRAVTGLVNATGVAVQANGTLVVEAANTVETFAANASGNAATVYSNSGPSTELATGFPASLAIDPWGEIYVANAATPSVTEYAQDAQNDAAPVARLVGGSTGLSNTPAVAIDAVGRVYVGHDDGTTNYISIFDPLVTVSGVTSSSGTSAGGQPVTIDGSTFFTPIDVTFGGVAATDVQVVSPTEITAVTPAHAGGHVDVAVTGDSGTATLTNGFTYQSYTITGNAETPLAPGDPAADPVTVVAVPAGTDGATLTWDAYSVTSIPGQADTCAGNDNVYESAPVSVTLSETPNTYSPADPPTFAGLGTYDWVVTLTDTTTNTVLAQTVCGDPSQQSNVDPFVVTTSATPIASAGTQVSDTATVTGSTPTGATIQFSAYPQNEPTEDCGTTAVYTSDAIPLNGAGTYNSGNATLPTGRYAWVATVYDSEGNVLQTGGCGDPKEITTIIPIIPGLAFTGADVNPATPWGALAALLVGGLLVGCGLLIKRARRRAGTSS